MGEGQSIQGLGISEEETFRDALHNFPDKLCEPTSRQYQCLGEEEVDQVSAPMSDCRTSLSCTHSWLHLRLCMSSTFFISRETPTQVITAYELEGDFAHKEGPAMGERNLAGESVRGKLRESMLCPITGEVFMDPVIAPSGHSFERSAIEKWLARRGTDPITRSCNPCRPACCRSCNSIRCQGKILFLHSFVHAHPEVMDSLHSYIIIICAFGLALSRPLPAQKGSPHGFVSSCTSSQCAAPQPSQGPHSALQTMNPAYMTLLQHRSPTFASCLVTNHALRRLIGDIQATDMCTKDPARSNEALRRQVARNIFLEGQMSDLRAASGASLVSKKMKREPFRKADRRPSGLA